MMPSSNLNLLVESVGHAESADSVHLMQTGEFRKATRAMALASVSIERALIQCDLKEKLKSQPAAFALVIGSVFGELEATKEFLCAWSDLKMARPLLFQNSLHNSTTGFLAIRFGITGPALTISHGSALAEQCLEAASLLMMDSSIEHCIVTTVETFLPELGASPLDDRSTTFIMSKNPLRTLATIRDADAAGNLLTAALRLSPA